ncbi:hydroxyisourate hydrolase [Robertmurraya korlensis]|jgi:5-hydroxyisourate hydrolase|uniref:hydroxyisourate hydrolase n=1 Tax=Robertmurraya korlensis TaxID=519977 RepID=UPI0008250E06|nr:hydroxyisourate hydrolase [Robertmurraya korlensis]
MTGLTTHILDLTLGLPASNVTIELYFQEESSTEWTPLKTAVTNEDGRLDSPFLSEKELKAGSYELVFHIGSYFRSKNINLPNPPFLDKIPVRCNIVDIPGHYHVPLLVSPWGYQVYRGS